MGESHLRFLVKEFMLNVTWGKKPNETMAFISVQDQNYCSQIWWPLTNSCYLCYSKNKEDKENHCRECKLTQIQGGSASRQTVEVNTYEGIKDLSLVTYSLNKHFTVINYKVTRKVDTKSQQRQAAEVDIAKFQILNQLTSSN